MAEKLGRRKLSIEKDMRKSIIPIKKTIYASSSITVEFIGELFQLIQGFNT